MTKPFWLATQTALSTPGLRPADLARRSPTFCRILEAGKKHRHHNPFRGLVYPRGSIKQSTVQRIVDSAIKGASSIYSSGIEPGFGCDLLAVAMGVDVESDLLDPRPGDHRLLA